MRKKHSKLAVAGCFLPPSSIKNSSDPCKVGFFWLSGSVHRKPICLSDPVKGVIGESVDGTEHPKKCHPLSLIDFKSK